MLPLVGYIRSAQAALWIVLLAFGLDGLVWDGGLVNHAHTDGERFHTHRDLHRAGLESHVHARDHGHDHGPTAVPHDADALSGMYWTAAAGPNDGFLHSHDDDHASGKFFPPKKGEVFHTPLGALENPPPASSDPAKPEAPHSRGPPFLLV